MQTSKTIKLSTSILSADFAKLGEQVALATQAGSDYIHVDVMDGHFVPNITFGHQMVEALKQWTNLPLDVHLMVEKPDKMVEHFVKAGATIVTVPVETTTHLHRVVNQIREMGAKPGVVLSPSTPLSAIDEIISDVDLILLMSVNPGFGGQKFITAVLQKMHRLRKMLDKMGIDKELEIDGGINAVTAPSAVEAGANVLVAGSAIYDHKDGVAEAIRELKKSFG